METSSGGSPRAAKSQAATTTDPLAADDGRTSSNPVESSSASLASSESAATASSTVANAPPLADAVVSREEAMADARPSLPDRLKTLLVGRARDLSDASVFHHVSLVAFLAWVGLGADGLSSSCYGPAEAFDNLGEFRYLAVFLTLAIVGTVFIISTCYSHIIEEFPSGGGGYLVASKLLGRPAGVVSGCALLVDYILTITVSIAASGDALFGLIGPQYAAYKLPAETIAILVLILLNLRGVKESVQVLLPIFLLFLLTHAIIIFGSVALHLPRAVEVTHDVANEVSRGLSDPRIGLFGLAAVLLRAYSLGAGTYTGIEAVSNSMPVMREPRVVTAKRTMRYMAISLALTAGGLIVAYLLLDITRPHDGRTMNQVLTEQLIVETGMQRIGLGPTFLWATLLSEGFLLIVAAQAGFIDGPRVLANMAHDSWAPRMFANLSDRLATHNGILLMGGAALGALWYSRGSIQLLIVMYSINVFVTFSLSMIGMCRHWWQVRFSDARWRRRMALFGVGALLCVSILVINLWVKFHEGGWLTFAATSVFVLAAVCVHRYYAGVGVRLKRLDESLSQVPGLDEPNLSVPDPAQPAAVVLVGGYSGLGIHTLLNAVRIMPNHFKSFVFLSVGVVDSGNFKGQGEIDSLRQYTQDNVDRYVELGRRLGMPSVGRLAIGTDPVDELEQLCRATLREFPKGVIFAGQLVFQRDNWLGPLLHNQTAYSLQRRLQWTGIPMMILPTRVR